MIHVHIERLILDGVPLTAEERPTLLQAAVARELGSLLTAGGIADGLQASGAVEAVRGAPMELGGGPVAGKIARAVYGGIGK